MSASHPLRMFRITLRCLGVPLDEGAAAARAIEDELGEQPWHTDVHCWWDGARLFLTAWNDFDETGQALRDEFSAALVPYVGREFRAEIETVEVLSMA